MNEVRLFGKEKWEGTPIAEEAEFVEPPIGQRCAGQCKGPILEGQSGIMLLHSEGYRPWHRICFFLNVLGPDVLTVVEDGTPKHMDMGWNTYEDGMFTSLCRCGRRFLGLDPDDADAKLVNHINEEN